MVSADILERLDRTLSERRSADPSTSYVPSCFTRGKKQS